MVILHVNPKQKKTLHVEYYKYYKYNMAPNNRFTIRVVGMIIWRLTKIDWKSTGKWTEISLWKWIISMMSSLRSMLASSYSSNLTKSWFNDWQWQYRIEEADNDLAGSTGCRWPSLWTRRAGWGWWTGTRNLTRLVLSPSWKTWRSCVIAIYRFLMSWLGCWTKRWLRW